MSQPWGPTDRDGVEQRISAKGSGRQQGREGHERGSIRASPLVGATPVHHPTCPNELIHHKYNEPIHRKERNMIHFFIQFILGVGLVVREKLHSKGVKGEEN